MKLKTYMVMVFDPDDTAQSAKFFYTQSEAENYRMDCECNGALAQVYVMKVDKYGNSVYEYLYT